MKVLFKKGFTLIEILFVIAIIAILIAVLLPQFSKMRQNQLLASTTSDIVSILNKASSQSINSLDSSSYGVYFEDDLVVLFKGEVYDFNSADNQVLNLNGEISISDINLLKVSDDTSTDEVYFERLSGRPDAYGDIILTIGSINKTINLTKSGGVSIN